MYIANHSIRQIENAGVSPNERDNDGATPAHFAAARGTYIKRIIICFCLAGKGVVIY